MMTAQEAFKMYEEAQRQTMESRVALFHHRLEATGTKPIIGSYYFFVCSTGTVLKVKLLPDDNNAYMPTEDFSLVEDQHGIRHYAVTKNLIPVE